jgi:hypothetical protein
LNHSETASAAFLFSFALQTAAVTSFQKPRN